MKEFTDLKFKRFQVMLKELEAENRHQVAKWGTQTHNLFEWLALVSGELGELSQAISEYTYRGGSIKIICHDAIQVATLACKIWEMTNVEELEQKIENIKNNMETRKTGKVDVYMKSCKDAYPAIQGIRAVTSCGLKEAKDFYDNIPAYLMRNIDAEDGTKIAETLKNRGVEVELKARRKWNKR